MEPQQDTSISKIIIGVIIGLVVLLILAGLIGWRIGRNHSDSAPDSSDSPSGNEAAIKTEEVSSVDQLVTYTVPEGFSKTHCGSDRDTVYFVQGSDLPDCETVPEQAMTLQIDEDDKTDCNELEDAVSTSRHVCRSISIDDHPALEVSTTYTKASTAMPERTVDAYYLNTGNGVVLARYIHDGGAPLSTAFSDLVFSLKVTR